MSTGSYLVIVHCKIFVKILDNLKIYIFITQSFEDGALIFTKFDLYVIYEALITAKLSVVTIKFQVGLCAHDTQVPSK